MKKLMPKPKGFTIIEVIIVLVVGAVIMLAVFLVVPQLQLSSRNSQRQKDARSILVFARDYLNSGGDIASTSVATDLSIRFVNYLPRSPFKDPSGVNYAFYIPAGSQYSSQAAKGKVTIGFNKRCNSAYNGFESGVTQDYNIAVIMPIEQSAATGKLCVEDSR
jgi:prepilin-type N-terminal cleavage/methylation domain-containing protein